MLKKSRVISFSGKGGTGKTTTCSLFLSSILSMGQFKDILVIDADPDANLGRTLGIAADKTVGQIVDKRKKQLDDREFGTSLRFSLWDTIVQGQGFDFLVMGRTTGEGCYCAVNSVLKSLLNDMLNMYDLILIDFDAGLEHFSRRTATSDDTLVVVCDPSSLSFDTARRIKNLIEELSLPYNRQFLVGCRYHKEQEQLFFRLAQETEFDILGLVPYDLEVASRNLAGQSLLSLGMDNPAQQAVNSMVKKIIN
ncbi:AAA family ATPase [Moorella sulfitireducens]|uniref:ATP-binding protein n=1 Tax=Neomoorella sulfitireducens TaxID=2972948 RepID=UPI0021AC185F|nr:AAA family ATPase [Moorella sulfitireducens]